MSILDIVWLLRKLLTNAKQKQIHYSVHPVVIHYFNIILLYLFLLVMYRRNSRKKTNILLKHHTDADEATFLMIFFLFCFLPVFLMRVARDSLDGFLSWKRHIKKKIKLCLVYLWWPEWLSWQRINKDSNWWKSEVPRERLTFAAIFFFVVFVRRRAIFACCVSCLSTDGKMNFYDTTTSRHKNGENTKVW